MVLGLFFVGWEVVVVHPCQPCLAWPSSRALAFGKVAPTVLPMQYNPIRSNARDDTTGCQKQTNSDQPSTTGDGASHYHSELGRQRQNGYISRSR